MEISVREAGRRGGLSNVRKYGVQHFVKIGRIGGLRTKALYSNRHSEWGKLGGRPKKPSLHQSTGELRENERKEDADPP